MFISMQMGVRSMTICVYVGVRDKGTLHVRVGYEVLHVCMWVRVVKV